MKYNPYTKNLKVKVFDIETMGLYANHDLIISASFINPDGTDLKQYFCDTPLLEKNLIQSVIKELESLDAVITYNGDMFDIPYVKTRATKYNIDFDLNTLWQIDLYKWLKKYWPVSKCLKSLKQKEIEKSLGLSNERTDEIDGGECIKLYNEFLSIGDEQYKNLILLHNADDVRQLAKISQAFPSLPYHKIAFDNGFLIKQANTLLKECSINANGLVCKAKSLKGLIPTDIYEDDYHIMYDNFTGIIQIDLPLKEREGFRFVDLRKLPICESDYKKYEEYHEGYLIIFNNNFISYEATNQLVKEIIIKIFG